MYTISNALINTNWRILQGQLKIENPESEAIMFSRHSTKTSKNYTHRN